MDKPKKYKCNILSNAARGAVGNGLCVIGAVVLCFTVFRFKGQRRFVLLAGLGRAI